MALKNFKPITPSLRQLVIVDRTGLWRSEDHTSVFRSWRSQDRRDHGPV